MTVLKRILCAILLPATAALCVYGLETFLGDVVGLTVRRYQPMDYLVGYLVGVAYVAWRMKHNRWKRRNI